MKLLILRLTPRGLNRPWLLTLRPVAISLSRASRHRGKRSGRNGRSVRHFSLDHAQGVDEAQSARIELLLPGGLLHELAHPADGKTPYQAARHLLDGAERRNRDTVLCREIVLSASPSYFRPGRESMGGVFEPDRVKTWATASLAWAKRQWPDQLASAVLHLDEMTPHMHLLVVPRVKSEAGAWKLNSKAVFDRERLRELQTGYGEALAPLGIRRGEPGSQAAHSEVRQFYGAVQAAKGMPQRAKLPPAPRAPTPHSGIAASAADALGSVLGIETTHQRAVKAHAEAMKQPD